MFHNGHLRLFAARCNRAQQLTVTEDSLLISAIVVDEYVVQLTETGCDWGATVRNFARGSLTATYWSLDALQHQRMEISRMFCLPWVQPSMCARSGNFDPESNRCCTPDKFAKM